MNTYSCRARDCEVVETFARTLRRSGMLLQDLRLYPHWPDRAPAHVDVQFDCDASLDTVLAELANLPDSQTMFDTLRTTPVAANPMTPQERAVRCLITRATLEHLAKKVAAKLPADPNEVTPVPPRIVLNLTHMALAALCEHEGDDLPQDELERLQKTARQAAEDDQGWGIFMSPDKALTLVAMAMRVHDQAA